MDEEIKMNQEEGGDESTLIFDAHIEPSWPTQVLPGVFTTLIHHAIAGRSEANVAGPRDMFQFQDKNLRSFDENYIQNADDGNSLEGYNQIEAEASVIDSDELLTEQDIEIFLEQELTAAD
ncbi:hypothetical protein E2562_032708 [Oryza meyeriana var. granulata]|uniref:Uncharacterized protein n=1 Tax=Oryza meyeriana var. granulata TaxID=110450 RepID=A0A6G1FFA1_9ORYZ|nr:hypothetical protein E2562_032708 [Oryza meyeriana var. granulata]